MNRVSFQPVLTLFALLLAALSPPAYTQQWPAADPVVTVDFSNPGTNPAHWVLVLPTAAAIFTLNTESLHPTNPSQWMFRTWIATSGSARISPRTFFR